MAVSLLARQYYAELKQCPCGRGLDVVEMPVLDRTSVVTVENDLGVVAVLGNADLDAFVRMIAVNDAASFEQPHLMSGARDWRVHYQLIVNTFAVEHIVVNHGVDVSLGVEIPQLMVGPRRAAGKRHHVGPGGVQPRPDLHHLVVVIVHDVKRTSLNGHSRPDSNSRSTMHYCRSRLGLNLG